MKAYSYVRFSTATQLQGDSLRRQIEASKRYCEQYGLVLDSTLNLNDLGVSAFKGLNAVEGKLGAFIEAVEKGKVEVGSTLLVESLDRLSRDNVLSALSQFTSIIDKGITIVTLSDNKVYTRESISDISNLMYSLLIMSRAHEESQIKSQRIKAAWENKKKLARELRIPKTKMLPNWIELIDGKYKLKEYESEAIKKIFDLYEGGQGYSLICKYMNSNYKPIKRYNRASKQWHQSYIVKVLNNEAVIGVHDGIKDYFPSLITLECWARVQLLRQSKQKSGGRKASTINLFSHISKCGYCGGSMIRVNRTKTKNDKKYNNIVMMCRSGKDGLTSCGSASWKMQDLEDKILRAVTELDIDLVMGNDVNAVIIDQIRKSIEKVQYELSLTVNNKHNLVSAIEQGGELKALVIRLSELEKQESYLAGKLVDLKCQYEFERTRYDNAKCAQQKLSKLLSNIQDNAVRIAVNAELKRIVIKIVFFNKDKVFEIEYDNKIKIQFSANQVAYEVMKDDVLLIRGDSLVYEFEKGVFQEGVRKQFDLVKTTRA